MRAFLPAALVVVDGLLAVFVEQVFYSCFLSTITSISISSADMGRQTDNEDTQQTDEGGETAYSSL